VTDRPRALAVLIAVFLLGCIIGSAGFYYWFEKKPNVPVANGRNGPPSAPPHQSLPELLQLTPDQEKRYREIMSEARKQQESLRTEQEEMWDSLRAKQAPKIKEIWAETNRKFSAILNEEQKAKFDAFLKEMDAMRKRPPHGRGFEPKR
jgi:Spy/CpxP family protein refolding chaperone